MDLGVEGRVYVVTGGSGGLGLATARELVRDGADVVLSGRHRDTLDAAVAELGPEHAEGMVADNADPSSPDGLIAAARTRFGRIDGVLISVGGPPTGTVMNTPDEDWTTSFSTVFLGAVRIARAFGAVLEDGGSIAFVLSSSVKVPLAGLALSNGLRPGLAMVAKTLAEELGERGIRVNGLLPGRIETDRVLWLDQQTSDPEATRARQEATIPLRRYGAPEEFGRAAAFLLSPAASFVTGAMLPIDGGMLRSL